MIRKMLVSMIRPIGRQSFEPLKRGFVLQGRKGWQVKAKVLEKTIPIIEQRRFDELSHSKLYSLEYSFEEYRKIESRVTLIESYKEEETQDDILLVRIETYGDYLFKLNQSEQSLTMVSPLSGVFKYYYDELNERWLNTKDDHLLEELILREIGKKLKDGIQL
jgi:frataxin-like iron-binding protein CyaY